MEKKVKLKPLHDRVVVRRLDEVTQSSGGIIIPDSAAEKPSRGEITAVGSGAVAKDGSVRKLAVNVGDHVLFGKFAGTEVNINDEDLIVMREDDIMAVIA